MANDKNNITSEYLKSRFKKGMCPTQKDYEDLIDYIGRLMEQQTAGIAGPKGDRGNGWFSGTLITDDNTNVYIEDTMAGDYYINTDTGDIYQYSSFGKNNWKKIGKVAGGKGEKGDPFKVAAFATSVSNMVNDNFVYAESNTRVDYYQYIMLRNDVDFNSSNSAVYMKLPTSAEIECIDYKDINDSDIENFYTKNFYGNACKWQFISDMSGLKGDRGRSWVNGTKVSADNLNNVNVDDEVYVGDYYLNHDTGDIYVCVGINPDGTTNWKFESSFSTNLKQSYISTVTVGNVNSGDEIPQFSSMDDIVKQIFCKALEPEITSKVYSSSITMKYILDGTDSEKTLSTNTTLEIGTIIKKINFAESVSTTLKYFDYVGDNTPTKKDEVTVPTPNATYTTTFSKNGLTDPLLSDGGKNPSYDAGYTVKEGSLVGNLSVTFDSVTISGLKKSNGDTTSLTFPQKTDVKSNTPTLTGNYKCFWCASNTIPTSSDEVRNLGGDFWYESSKTLISAKTAYTTNYIIVAIPSSKNANVKLLDAMSMPVGCENSTVEVSIGGDSKIDYKIYTFKLQEVGAGGKVEVSSLKY